MSQHWYLADEATEQNSTSSLYLPEHNRLQVNHSNCYFSSFAALLQELLWLNISVEDLELRYHILCVFAKNNSDQDCQTKASASFHSAQLKGWIKPVLQTPAERMRTSWEWIEAVDKGSMAPFQGTCNTFMKFTSVHVYWPQLMTDMFRIWYWFNHYLFYLIIFLPSCSCNTKCARKFSLYCFNKWRKLFFRNYLLNLY